MENPPKKFFRLSPGKEVRLRYAYFITCREVVKNAAGEVVELRCTYDPATKGGNAPDGRKVKATIHWVSAAASIPAEVRLYNPLFTKPDPNVAEFAADLNPNSLEVLAGARLEPALAEAAAEVPVQFERNGYFCLDREFDARQSGVHPHHRPARHIRQGHGEGKGGGVTRLSFRRRPQRSDPKYQAGQVRAIWLAAFRRLGDASAASPERGKFQTAHLLLPLRVHGSVCFARATALHWFTWVSSEIEIASAILVGGARRAHPIPEGLAAFRSQPFS